jgi:hypothetical protein
MLFSFPCTIFDNYKYILLYADIRPKPKTHRDPDSEFNNIHFGIEINKKKFFKKFQKF